MTFLSALILGLVASAHCAGMCGGLQVAIQSGAVIRSRDQQLMHLLLLNLGRIATYVMVGAALSTLSYTLVVALNLSGIAYWMRVVSGVLIFVIGLQIAFNARPLQLLEHWGSAIWKPMSGLIRQSSVKKRHSLLTGVAWGFLPCGLVYSVMLVAILSNDIASSMTLMLGFGLGTLPSLLLTGLLYQRFKSAVSASGVQAAGGVFFMSGGVLMLSAPFWVSKEFLYDYPVLLNTVFCVT